MSILTLALGWSCLRSFGWIASARAKGFPLKVAAVAQREQGYIAGGLHHYRWDNTAAVSRLELLFGACMMDMEVTPGDSDSWVSDSLSDSLHPKN